MHDVVSARHVGGYALDITFDNGRHGVVDFTEYLTRGVFTKLQHPDFFKRFFIDRETKTLCWPDEIDIDPDTLYHKATGERLPEWMSNTDD
ncbi:MAG: DUF2442 domain-containing protein [Spirochaetota bacterium]